MAAYVEEEEVFKCPKHPSKRRRNGICPTCLRDRLITLCPECANVRPCSCCPATTSSSSASSSTSSSFSFFSSASSSRRGGRVADLIDQEPAFRRSRSVGVPFLFTRFAREKQQAENSPPRKKRGSRRAAFLAKFGLYKKREENGEKNKEIQDSTATAAAAEEEKFANFDNNNGDNECRESFSNANIEEFANMMMRSRSVSVGMMNNSGEGRYSSASATTKEKGWSFRSPMKVFRSKTPKVANDRSPMSRG